MHYDEMEECGEMLANVRSFGMSNENLLHQAQTLVDTGIGSIWCQRRKSKSWLPKLTKLCVKRQNNII